MKRIFGALATCFVLSANATTPFKGSTVFVSPLLLKNTPASAKPRVMRMPVQAGFVESVITTRFPNSENIALIIKGQQYYSLCTPNQARVACAPLTPTETMRDILVSAYVDDNRVSLLAFSFAPETKRTPAELAFAIAHFKDRFAKVGAHFDRMSVTYKPRTPRNRGGAPIYPRSGGVMPMEADKDGCFYADNEGYDCTGGESGGWEGGYDIDTYPWSRDQDGDTSDPASIPTFPPGNDNGDRDPCLSPSGDNICQQVVITADRPNLDGCVFTPLGSVCQTRPPPTPLDPYEALPPAPSGRKPWFAQSTCNRFHFLCSEGQLPEDVGTPPVGDHERLVEWTQACLNAAQGTLNMCKVLGVFQSAEWVAECTARATAEANACLAEYQKGAQ